MNDPATITEMLCASREGDAAATERFLAAVYDELRQIAHIQRYPGGAHETMNTTALVHEAYVKLIDGDRLPFDGRGHFFAAAARAMRQVLVDDARAKQRSKRGYGQRPASLDAIAEPAAEQTPESILALDEALTRFARLDARAAQVVECRHFAGLSVIETAETLGISATTVKREWATARAWLFLELSEAPRPNRAD